MSLQKTLPTRPDFTTITELPETRASADQCAILYTRYHLARQFCLESKVVLEVGCGSGIGLGYLARTARQVVGGDVDSNNCRLARNANLNNNKISICQMDGHRLPLTDSCVDLIILFEALYYFHDPAAFLRESRRVLRPDGILLISSVNSQWSGFNPSPFSTRYLRASELFSEMTRHGFRTRILTGFPAASNGIAARIVRGIRKLAVRFQLIPNTMKGKEWLKRMFFGQLTPLPAELPESFAPVGTLIEAEDLNDIAECRMLFAIGRRA